MLLWPLLGRRRYQRLQQKLSADPEARLRVYRRMILHQWMMVLAVTIILAVGSIPAAEIGLRPPVEGGTIQAGMLLILLAAIAASGLFFRWKGDRFVQRMLRMAAAILPATPTERWLFAAISIGAGISEELLFRGFLLYYIDSHFPGLDWPVEVLISGVLFGFAHLFQGWRGMIVTGALGATFALLYLGSGSLLAPMAIHAAIDLRVLIILSPERVRLLGLPAADRQAAG